MARFLDEDFAPAVLKWPAAIQSEEYYVNTAIAWFYATALAKQWDAALPYAMPGRLPEEVRRRTIRKAIESYRLTPAQKDALRAR